MNLKEFLASGLLEAYVLGHCSPVERQQVEAMLASHEEARAELEAIETALEAFSRAQGVKAPEWMKGRIMEQIAREAQSGAPPASPGRIGPSHWLLGLALAGALGYGLMVNRQSHALEQENLQIAQDLRECNEKQVTDSRLQAFLLHPGTIRSELRWLDTLKSGADGLAFAYDNRELDQTLVQTIEMPPLNADQDYQFWIVRTNDPNPVPYNVFQGNSARFELRSDSEIAAFAVSVEPKGGSPNGKPTKVVMMGKV